MEKELYNRTAPKTEYPASFFAGAKNSEDVFKRVLDELAKTRGWVYNADNKELSESANDTGGALSVRDLILAKKGKRPNDPCVRWFYEIERENGEYIQTRLYELSQYRKKLDYDGVLFHWNADFSICEVFTFPVFLPDDSGVIEEYYEHSSRSFYFRDHVLAFIIRETYADSADIHDHGHDDIESGFIYDTEHRVLKYYSPDAEEEA